MLPLQSRAQAGVRQEIVALTEIPNVGGSSARALFNAGLRSVEAVAKAKSPAAIADILTSGSVLSSPKQQQQLAMRALKIWHSARQLHRQRSRVRMVLPLCCSGWRFVLCSPEQSVQDRAKELAEQLSREAELEDAPAVSISAAPSSAASGQTASPAVGAFTARPFFFLHAGTGASTKPSPDMDCACAAAGPGVRGGRGNADARAGAVGGAAALGLLAGLQPGA
jgi:hypothetical protein